MISFSATYSLREYLSFVNDHLPDGLAELGSLSMGMRPGLIRPFLLAASTVSFFFKKRRMPVCEFTIDENEIRRTTREGTLVVPWSKVRRVFRYSQGYVVRDEKGVLALPYRCFTPEAKAAFETWSGPFGAPPQPLPLHTSGES